MYLFFLAQGLDFTQIAILEVVYNLTTLVGEIPTGYVGDRIGRKNSLLIGTALIAVSLLGIGLAESFPALAILSTSAGLGYNFRSGSEDAWLYDTLTDGLSENEFANVRGRGESAALAVGAGAAVVGGYLGSIDLSYPWFVASAVTGLGVVVLFTFDEPETYKNTENTDADEFPQDRRNRQRGALAPEHSGFHPLLLRAVRCRHLPRVRVPPANIPNRRHRPRRRYGAGRVSTRMVLRGL